MSSHKFASSFGCLDAWMLRFRCRDLRFPVSVGASFSKLPLFRLQQKEIEDVCTQANIAFVRLSSVLFGFV